MLVTYLNGRIVEFTDTEMLGFAGSGSVSTHFAFVKGTSMVLAETYGTSSGTAGGNATALWDISGDKYTLKNLQPTIRKTKMALPTVMNITAVWQSPTPKVPAVPESRIGML